MFSTNCRGVGELPRPDRDVELLRPYRRWSLQVIEPSADDGATRTTIWNSAYVRTTS